ncbi:MAG: PhnD/SsuA/transferrin family substrate-binding protein [Cyanobacteria bacterium P01_G01_bin.49]
MTSKISRRLFLLLSFLWACSKTSPKREQWVIGTISYQEGDPAMDHMAQYESFNRYFQEKTHSFIKLEPAFNENKALERIQSQAWSFVFAPPGLAAIAINQYQYIPLLPLEGIRDLLSILVVRDDSLFKDLKSLMGQVVALGQPGSATGYYFPLFNLYGLTLADLLFAPTPKAVLNAIAQKKAAAGAVSMEQFDTHRTQFADTKFRILFRDLHEIPPGLVLMSPTIDDAQQKKIRTIFNEIPSIIANEAGFVPNSPVPDYEYMISVVERVRSILPNTRSSQKPIRLFTSPQNGMILPTPEEN